jgi:hypothetical protein
MQWQHDASFYASREYWLFITISTVRTDNQRFIKLQFQSRVVMCRTTKRRGLLVACHVGPINAHYCPLPLGPTPHVRPEFCYWGNSISIADSKRVSSAMLQPLCHKPILTERRPHALLSITHTHYKRRVSSGLWRRVFRVFKILSRVWVTIDGVWIDDWIYWTLRERNHK